MKWVCEKIILCHGNSFQAFEFFASDFTFLSEHKYFAWIFLCHNLTEGAFMLDVSHYFCTCHSQTISIATDEFTDSLSVKCLIMLSVQNCSNHDTLVAVNCKLPQKVFFPPRKWANLKFMVRSNTFLFTSIFSFLTLSKHLFHYHRETISGRIAH